MNILLVLIPLSLMLVIAAVYAFFWAVDNDQFEDMETPALDILADDDAPMPQRARDADLEKPR
jgi:cbb3-type cytochrome oxidase maturation protein